MKQSAINNFSTTLSADMNVGATTMTLTSVSGLPSFADGRFLEMTVTQAGGTETSWEIVKVTGNTGTACNVVRAQESTAEANWASGSLVECRMTAGTFEEAALGLIYPRFLS